MKEEGTNMEKLDGTSMNIVEHNIGKLKELFPEVFSEGNIKFDQLQELLGNYVTKDEDHYNFTWYGKRKAARLAQSPSSGTLRPCKEESNDWDITQNLFLEGDNLEVLKLLQKSYHRQIKMIYIDPPYNTGNDFVYKDDFRDGVKNYLRITSQLDSEGKRISTNSSTAGRFHTNWLNMMYPRLKLARNLLRDDGVIFISIDDNEQSNLRKLCDEIFGETNFVNNVIWEKKYAPANDAKWFSDNHDFILCYAKIKDIWRPNMLPRTDEQNRRYINPDDDPRGLWKSSDLSVKTYSEKYDYPITTPSGRVVNPPTGRCWRIGKDGFLKLVSENRIWFGSDGNNVPSIKRFLSEVKDGITPLTIWPYRDVGHNQTATREIKELFQDGDNRLFDTPKPTSLIKRVIEIGTNKDSIILDFFAGSGTTAHATWLKNIQDNGNRKVICVQLPERIKDEELSVADLTKKRLKRAAKKIREAQHDYMGDLGFKVFKLDSSNIKRWEADFDTLEQDLLHSIENIKQDRTSEDVLFEILLKYGLKLTVPIETHTIEGKTVYSIGLGALVVCLEEDISLDVVNGIGALKEKLKPEIMRVVFKDDCFEDDVVKTNALQTLKRYGIDDIKSF